MDGNLENGRSMVRRYFTPKTATVIEINYHHAMPWQDADLMKFSGAIRKLYTDKQDG